MRTLGILGGMSWESTASYYQILNRGINQRAGGLHSAPLLLASYDFAVIEQRQATGDWPALGRILADTASRLQNAGAEGILISTNTMHQVAPEIEARISVPLLHIADATATALQAKNIRRVALLGTIYTMQMDFYRTRLQQRMPIEVLTPADDQQRELNRIIYEELCLGQLKTESLNYYRQVIDGLIEQGVEGVILGCTEIGLLVKQQDIAVPLFDTTDIHCNAAIEWMIGSD